MKASGVIIRRLSGTGLAVLVSLEAFVMMTVLSEAIDDGAEIPLGETGPGSLLLSIAPFGLTFVLAPLLIGVIYWGYSRWTAPSIPDLLFQAAVVLVGWVGMSVALAFYKQVAELDGGREPTLAMWISNGLLLIGLAVGAIHSCRRRGG